jgi:hypothetical protein
MAEQSDDKGETAEPRKADGRRARLEQALRANLLKRKAKARTGKASRTPPEEGGQAQG